ncbi:uncharacterized protein LOC111316859 [Durio zibethinus]|uniref:Uncharacterized protein LOC111316859 n=1 Tax=Durio zibethinus TaxID=66656 RepID=A0A6P6BCI3_DURZI|nr:uncharacterized protein LOC111316859 [Durio zibethinus]
MGKKKGVPKFEEMAPHDFDRADPYEDSVAMLEMKEHIVREKWINKEKAKILRDKSGGVITFKESTISRSVATSFTRTSTPLAASVGAKIATTPPSMINLKTYFTQVSPLLQQQVSLNLWFIICTSSTLDTRTN